MFGAGYYLNDKTKCFSPRNLGFVLSNGMTGDIVFYDWGYYQGTVTVDINGNKGPNTHGRDVFTFNFLDNGTLAPPGGLAILKSSAEYSNVDFESELSKYHWERVDRCSKTTTERGHACASRIIESGWKMDY